jgi:hypothetical protein
VQAGPRCPILALWSLPRSRSTAFFLMMAQRGDFLALHEPFSNLAEFGTVTVGGTQARSATDLLAAIRAAALDQPVFFKDTTDERYPELLADREFLRSDARHTFLIRHPRETIASYYQLNPLVRQHQIGVAALHEIFVTVRNLTGRQPVVIDAADLVKAPGALVRAYCDAVSIPFRPDALRWQPGQRQQWQPTRRWHERASQSSGFEATAPAPGPDVDSHPALAGYLRYHLPFYEDLRRYRLRV